ncbi:protein phosphatase [Streptomyces sp. SA15]|uniref:ADP-ribosyltransferase n=1 Tax=Streptomyces sp. SA15 TaxID=934019 RepID=UPI000BB05399|nr:ADP-ribosyltransferase [Streptomyces sp. SA15]PAZ12438.1 protein phosphatase [Streptomyces sp. SA15]
MIKPEQIPQYTGNLPQLEIDYADLKKDAGHVRKTGEDVHAQFQGLSAYYTAPEAEQLFATTKPVKERADDFATDLETVSGALSSYATEIRPLVDKLKELKAKAVTFVDSVKDDDEWEYDGDKVDEHNQIRDDITATVAAFWAAERTCHNKITALWGGTQMVAGDGSERKDQYGFNAEDMKNAKLPWGDPVEEKHKWYEVGHWVKSFVWDGLIVDGIWGTIKGLGMLVGFGGWDAMGQAWKGLAQLATGLTLSMMPGAQVAFWALPDDKLPAWIRDSRTAMKETGKALVAWDQWGKNPARAAGAVTFNVVTTVFTGGAGAGVAGAGKAGAVAKALSVAGKAGHIIDPMTYVAKGAGAGLSKIGDIAKGLKGVGNIDIPTLPDGAVSLPDGRLMDPNGNLVAPNGTIDTTPVPHDAGPTVPHGAGTTPTLPAHWTVQGAPTPSYAAAHAGTDGAAHSVDNAGHYNAPNPGHYSTPTPAAAASHTPGGAFDSTPSPGSYDHAPSQSSYGQAPSGSPYDHAPSPSAYDQTPGVNPYAQTPSGAPYGHAPSPSAYDHAPSPSSYDQTPAAAPHDAPAPTPHTGGSNVPGGAAHPGGATPWYHQTPAASAAHDVPTTAPHPGGHDVPGTGGHTPDAPHGPGHGAPGVGHADDASHGAGHGDDGVGHHADDAGHAGDHAGVGDAAAHHGSDAPVAPGHQGADVPGSGAGEPFEYQPHMSADDFDNLATDAEKHAVATAELARGTNPAPSVSNEAGLAYGNAYWNDFLDDLSPESREALRTYSGNEYDLINSHLRFGDDLDPSLMHTIDEMDKVMDTRPVPEDVMVVRGTGVDHIRIDGQPLKSPLDMEGGVFDDKAYTSTALGKTPPPPFDSKPVWMHLRVAKDTPALWIDHLSKHPGERELLLAKGSEYKVTRVFQDTMGKWHVYGEILPRPKP